MKPVGVLAGALVSLAIPLVAGAVSLLTWLGVTATVALAVGTPIVAVVLSARALLHRGATSLRIELRLRQLEAEREVLVAEHELLRSPADWHSHAVDKTT
jgi:hypothetical protein